MPKQKRFILSRNKELLYSGAIRCGKSRALCYKIHRQAIIPGNRVGLFRRYFSDLQATTLRTLLEPDGDLPPILLPGSYTHNKNLHRIQINGGGEISYYGFDRMSKLGSMGFGMIGVDEAHELDEDQYQFLLGRLSFQVDPYRQLCSVTNPASPSHFLHKRFFQEGCEEGQGDAKFQYIHTTTYDNPFLPPDYVESLKTFDPQNYKRYVLGLWVAFEGLVYSNFDRNDNNLPWTYSRECPTYAFIDFGYRKPAVLFVQHDTRNGNDRWVIFDELLPENCPREQLLRLIQQKGYQLHACWGDPAGDAKDDSGISTIGYFANNGLLVSYSTETQKRSIPAGVEIVRSLICDASGTRRLFVDVKQCPKTVEALESYHYPDKLTTDEPVKDGLHDHAMDALRYGCVNQVGLACDLSLLQGGGNRTF